MNSICEAKKGGKSKNKVKRKDNSANAMGKPSVEPWKSTSSIMLLLILIENYKRAAGK